MSADGNWLDDQNQQRLDYQNVDKPVRRRKILEIACSKYVKVWAILAIFALVVPALVYYFTFDDGIFPVPPGVTCMVQETFRVPCGKVNLTREECWSLSCCFDQKESECYHSLPSRYFYVKSEDSNIYETFRKKSPLGTRTKKKVFFAVSEKSENVVKIKLAVYNDSSTEEYEHGSRVVNKMYDIRVKEKELAVEIFRKDTQDGLLSTDKGPLIVSDWYLEWTLYLTNANGSLFGINQTLIQTNKWEKFTKVFYKNKLDHYSLPALWAYSKGKFSGVSISHEGPLEITVLPSNLIILRSLTLDNIEIEVDAGHTPKMLHDQFRNTTKMPPYWAMETHICRAGNTLDLHLIVSEFEFENSSTSYCIDEHLVLAFMMDDGKNTTVIKAIFEEGKKYGKKFVLSLPPHVLADSNLHKVAEKLGILYQYNGTTHIGSYLDHDVVYPDYSSTNINMFLTEMEKLIALYVTVPIDGLILSDNWPVDDSFRMNGTDFKYFTEELEEAMSFTLPWNSTSSSTDQHAKKHNTYGSSHLNAIKTFYSSKNPDIFIMSASKSPDQTETLLMEDVDTSWDELRNKLQNILFQSITGNHLVILPVCGDTKNYDPISETLCIRWYLIAATMPMFRISSVIPWRDPESLSTKFAEEEALKAIDLRHQLLTLYYTILSYNEPVIRPMFYDFYYDESTFKMDMQYMIGSTVLIAHPFSPGRKLLHVYLPRKVEIWYEMWEGRLYNSTVDPWINLTIVENDFVVFLAQGTILPLKTGNEINLLVAQNCSKSCEAETVLLLGNYVHFSASDTNVSISNLPPHCNYTIGYIKSYGYPNGTASSKYYDKQIEICTGKSSITIKYENAKDEEDL